MIHQLTKLLLTVMLIFTTESFRCNLTVCLIEHLQLFLVWAFSISTKIGSYNIFREVADLSVTAILAQANCSYCLCRAYIYFHLILLKCSLMYDLRRYWQILGFFLTDMKSVTKGTTHSFMNLYGSAKFFNVTP